MFQKLKKIAKSYHVLPDKKRYAEFITALLSIPVLITVLLTNLNSLNSKDEKSQQPEPESKSVIISYVPSTNSGSDPAPTAVSDDCKKGIGDVQITSPREGEVITEDPVVINISSDDDYCSVVWSYRINDGKWSEYDDNSVSLYNVKNGETRFDLRIKSTTNKEEKILTRKFIYTGNIENSGVTPTTTPAAN